MQELIQLLSAVVTDWKAAGALAGLIAAVNLLVALSKMPFLASRIKPSWRPWIALAFGAVGGFLGGLANGQPWHAAAMAGLIAGLGAIGTNQLWGTLSPTSVARTQAAATVKDALSGPQEAVAVKVAALKSGLDAAAAIPDEKERMKALAAWANASSGE